MQLKYYNGDYSPIGFTSTENLSGPYYKPLYNGNIAAWQMANNYAILTQLQLTSNVLKAEGEIYNYDLLGRLRASRFLQKTANWLHVGLKIQTDYTYDANGNITTLNRNRYSSGGAPIDILAYNYNTLTNKLNYITDGAGKVLNDLPNQSADNYLYDGSGNLTKDESENLISIEWTADGKVKEIQKYETHSYLSGCGQLVFEGIITTTFYYDAQGRRVAKYRDASNCIDWQIWNSCMEIPEKAIPYDLYGSRGTYYIRDANGEILAIYEGRPPLVTADNLAYLRLFEQLIYGSEGHGKFASRIDENKINYSLNLATTPAVTDQHKLGEKFYDISRRDC
jgi:hypothetical protein